MSKTKAILLSAVAGLGLTAAANAAPIINTRLTLLDSTTQVELPKTGSTYLLTPGQHFLVQLGATIQPGTENVTDSLTGRAAATRNQPLGIQNLTVDILGNANVHPVNDGTGNWQGYTDLTPDAFAYGAQPITDSTADADALPFDLSGAGFANNGAFTTGTTATSLAKAQYGVTGKTVEYIAGEYVATGSGTLSVVKQAVNVYAENSGNNNNLDAVDNTANTNNTSVQVQVPEPASLGLLSLVGLAFGRRRRA